ncbi:SCO family protein [Sphaerotilus sp.]|uniref:SCO family protein n=1 Tax=Sphaerotilus sp. TaxID=2093942 RepID=UPI002ACE407B|nr:SCO family protein [Sphaerotilus sp.]MDZ7857108.1 SCO family protein [Sphaerotilus sp.]
MRAGVQAATLRRAGLSALGMLGVAAALLAAEGMTPARLWSAWLAGSGGGAGAGVVAAPDAAINPQHPWDAAYFPNPVLTTQDGTRVRFYDDLIKGKTVAINTFFSVCTDVCPLSTAKMLELQRRLGDRVGRDVFFYSLSVDPEHDTPASMKDYAQRYGVGPGWLFLTGKPEDIQLISRRMGLGMLQAESPRDAHSTTLMVGHEPSGQWMKHSSTDNPQFVAAMMGTFFGWKAEADAPDYRQAAALQITSGEFLFRNGCAACHSIGEGDRIGPDLKDVAQRRDPVWLERFVREPDVLIDGGDPLAQALLQRYKGVRMPNLGLKPDEVAEILTYIAARSAKVAQRP